MASRPLLTSEKNFPRFQHGLRFPNMTPALVFFCLTSFPGFPALGIRCEIPAPPCYHQMRDISQVYSFLTPAESFSFFKIFWYRQNGLLVQFNLVTTLRAVVSPGRTLRERNHCEQPFDSLIEPPSSAVDE